MISLAAFISKLSGFTRLLVYLGTVGPHAHINHLFFTHSTDTSWYKMLKSGDYALIHPSMFNELQV